MNTIHEQYFANLKITGTHISGAPKNLPSCEMETPTVELIRAYGYLWNLHVHEHIPLKGELISPIIA